MKKLLVFLSLISSVALGSEVYGPQPIPAVESGVVQLTKDNSLTINGVFEEATVATIVKQSREMDSRVTSGDPLYLVIHSPGGLIDAGLELIENLSTLKRPIHTITIFSASMGFQTVQGLGDRLILKNGTLMSHKARGGVQGEFPGQLDSRYAFELKRVLRMNEQAVKRSKGKYTMETYGALVQNEFWCDGQECVEKGFADKVITASCDKSLDGTKLITADRTAMMGHSLELKLEYDTCPLNTNYLRQIILVDGQPFFNENTGTGEPQRKMSQQDPLSTLFGSYYETPRSIVQSLSKDEIDAINKHVQEVLRKMNRNEVFYGY